MEHPLITLAYGAVLFLAIAVTLRGTLKNITRATIVSCFIAAASGLVIYVYGYIATNEHPVAAIPKSVFSVCRMFMGESDYSEVSGAYGFTWMHIFAWGIHLLAFYTTVSAAVSVIGKNLLKKLALRFGPTKEISIVYGIHPDSLELGSELETIQGNRVVFVDKCSAASEGSAASDAGFLARFDSDAVCGTPAFLKSVGAYRSGITVSVYTLAKDPADNREFARNVLTSLEKGGVQPEHTYLTILGRENPSVLELQNSADHYGYGFVTVFQEHQLTARLLIRNYPPCNYISFDDTGKATEDFHVLMVGFGRMGQENLKQLIMNGQFEGSRFKASVFAPNCDATSGFFFRQNPSLMDHYDISFHPYDGRSVQIYDYIFAHRNSLKYVVVNTGSDKLNGEITEDLSQILSQFDNPPPVFQCSYQEIIMKYADSAFHRCTDIYSRNVLAMHKIDDLAMLINQQYQGSHSKGALQDWMNCDYFSRMSCRAFADFMAAYLRMVNKTEADILAGGWNPTPEQLDNMSKTEHSRWCAFHYCMGFSPMSPEEYDSREAQYLYQKAHQITPLVRVGKNMEKKTHACLISWDELDILSARESRVTGKSVDYKQYDTDNILTIPQLLQKKSE
jgi:hypothetical protein